MEEEEEHGNKSLEQQDTERARERWEHYFTQEPSKAKYIIRTSKENGEAAHFSQFRWNGVQYYVFGSKNVHLIVKQASDLQKYTDKRYMTATMIANAMINQIVTKKDDKIQKFLDHLEKNDLSCCFEFLNVEYQHVEFFDFKDSKYRFITFTSNKDLKQLVDSNFEKNLTVAQEAGFETVKITTYQVEQQNKLFDEIREDIGNEGSVLYYFTADNTCIGMVSQSISQTNFLDEEKDCMVRRN